jgi:hypothetical protein
MLCWLLSALAIAGYVMVARTKLTLLEFVVPLSLMIIVVWPWDPSRLVMPLLPFVLFYTLMGVRLLHRLRQQARKAVNVRTQSAVLGVLVWCLVALSTHINVKHILSLYGPPDQRLPWIKGFEENETMINWVGKNLPKDEIIIAPNAALLHLYTGNKTVSADDPDGNWENWKQMGVRHLVWTSTTRLSDPDLAESKYKRVYRSSGLLNLRVLDLGPPSSRLPWSSVAPPITAKVDTFK